MKNDTPSMSRKLRGLWAWTAYEAIRCGEVPVVRLGRRGLVRTDDRLYWPRPTVAPSPKE